MTVGDDGLEGVDGPMLRPLVFAHGTSNELTSDNFLFDVYRSDFRKKNQDFDVPLPVMELEVEEESPPIHTKGDETTSEEPDAATSADQEKEKSVDKVEEKKPPAKGGASKGSAAKGGAAKGGASKGKLSGVKKKR